MGPLGDPLPTAVVEVQTSYEAKKSAAEVVVERHNQ